MNPIMEENVIYPFFTPSLKCGAEMGLLVELIWVLCNWMGMGEKFNEPMSGKSTEWKRVGLVG